MQRGHRARLLPVAQLAQAVEVGREALEPRVRVALGQHEPGVGAVVREQLLVVPGNERRRRRRRGHFVSDRSDYTQE